MEPVKLSNIKIKGELAVRSGLNYSRLEGRWYRPDEVFSADQHGWPADWEGRIILALSLLSQSTHRTPAYLDDIVSELPKHLNEKGYLGQILPEGKFDEQQLAGHSWLIRGLIEYYKITKSENVKVIIEGVVNNLLLASKGCYCKYPVTMEEREKENDTWVLSKLQSKTKNHAGTSDAGCGFIMLDGATAAYELLKWPDLKQIIDEMIETFLKINLDSNHIQTHATLSALRGILRLYELTAEQKYLEIVINKFDFYKAEAWTEAYGNYNWFGVPRWTEPCAIIDSYIVAVGLWKVTGNPQYIEEAHKIYFNAISHGQRYTGAFGTDKCVGAAEAEDRFFISPQTFEVYWCCSMRGGEGFTRAIEYNFFIEKDSIYIPFYNNCTAKIVFDDGYMLLEEKTEYPYNGSVSFKILESTSDSSKTIKLFAPSWADKYKVSINGNMVDAAYGNGFAVIDGFFISGDIISVEFEVSVRSEEGSFKNSVKGCHKFLYGPMILAYKGDICTEISVPSDSNFERVGRSEFRIVGYNGVFTSLCDVKDLTSENSRKQVIFKS